MMMIVHHDLDNIVHIEIQLLQTKFHEAGHIPPVVLLARDAFFGKGEQDVSGGGIGNEADSTDTVTSIDSDTVDRIDRHSNRVSRKGRFHQVRFAVDPLGTDTSATKVEIHQIATSFRALPDNS